MGFDECPRDRQSDPAAAAGAARTRFIGPVETVEEMRQMFSRDPNARILNRDLDFIVLVPRLDNHPALFRSVLQRIPRQVGQHLHGAVLVGEDMRQLGGQVEFQGDPF